MIEECPLISVVMSCYNSEQFIREAIESVLAQTYTRFEFIIWDDGSTDGTRSIVESFKDDRIRYYYNDNTGLGKALCLACAEAKGKYIARMDADDICLPERLSREVAFLETNRDFVLVSSAVFFIDEQGKITDRSFPCTNDRVLKGILLTDSMIVHPMVLMRRDAYEKSGGYVAIRYLEDVLFWNRLAKHGKFYNIPTPLGKYRMLANSLGHSRGPYDRVLYELRQKMSNDEIILESDIQLYNSIYLYSKQFHCTEPSCQKRRENSVERHLFCLLSPILGQSRAEIVIVSLKNMIYRWKLGV